MTRADPLGAELPVDCLRVFLRQCLACFGARSVLYIGPHIAHALDFLLSEGLDTHVLAPDPQTRQDALRRFAADRVGLAQAGQPLPDDIWQRDFGALVLVASQEPGFLRQWLEAAAKRGVADVVILLPADTSASVVEADGLALGYRQHPRAAFVRSAFMPDLSRSGWRACFFERAAVAPGNLPSGDFLHRMDPASTAAFDGHLLAAQWARVGDTVLVLDDTAGSGPHVIACNCAAQRVLAIETDPARHEYATGQYARPERVAFSLAPAGQAPAVAAHSVDVLVCLNAAEAAWPNWQSLVDAVRPGGRVVLGFGGGDGANPEPAVEWFGRIAGAAAQRCLPEAAFVLEMPTDADRVVRRRLALNDPVAPGSGRVLVVAMIDPVGADSADYVETAYRTVDTVGFAVLPDRRSMLNPWLFKSMIAGGMRLTHDAELERVTSRVRKSSPPDSADYGAALCGHAYRLLGAHAPASEIRACLNDIQAYLGTESDNVHHLRWSISLSYIAAKLAQSLGELRQAEDWALRCAAMDPMPFSPLLGTKTIAALDLAAMLALSRHDSHAARERLERAVREVPRLLSGDWLNVLGDFSRPLSFGLPEVAQLAEAGARCAYLLNYLDDNELRPGWVWREHRGFYERVLEMKDGQAGILEQDVRFLNGETQRLEHFIQGQQKEIKRLDDVIRERDGTIRHMQEPQESIRTLARTLVRRCLLAVVRRLRGTRGAPIQSPPPVPAPARKPKAPLLLDEARAGRWIAAFPPAAPGQAALRIIAASELPVLGRPPAGTVVAAVFQAGDNPYAMRSLVYEHVDLCIALDRAVFLALALLHPMVIEATAGTLSDYAARFHRAAADGHAMPVPPPAQWPAPPARLMLQVDNFMVGGLERVIFDLLAYLAEAGFSPVLGVTGDIAAEAEAELQQRQFRHIRLPADGDALLDVLRNEKIALVNAHYSLSLSEPCAVLGIPFVQTVHNMYMWLDAAGKEAWRRADQVTDAYICVSANVAMFADINLRLGADRMIVVPNGCDARSDQPLGPPEVDAALREEFGFPADSPVFVNVASINPIKGQGLLIDAFAIAHARRPDIRLVILGTHADTAYAKRLQERIAHHGLQGAVFLPGHRPDVYRFVDLARAVVMPSFSEGWSLAISEALQRNAPVIATDVGGAREQLIDEASTVIPAYWDDWATLDSAAFFDAMANESKLHGLRDELARVLLDYAQRPVRQRQAGLRQSFQSMTPAQAYARHAELFTALLGATPADGIRHACYRPQRQSRYAVLQA